MAGSGSYFPPDPATSAGIKYQTACKPGSVTLRCNGHSSGIAVTCYLTRPTRAVIARNPQLPLFGLAPGGVFPATPVTRSAVRSYRTFSPLPTCVGGIFSVALSLRSPSPDVIRHRVPWSPDFPRKGEYHGNKGSSPACPHIHLPRPSGCLVMIIYPAGRKVARCLKGDRKL
jgi:hypothetical protein